jgi:polyisoprenoid-binding protein YceI
MIATLLAALLAAAAPGPRTFAVDPAASTLSYHLVHKLHRVDGDSRTMEGKAILQPDGKVLAMVRAPVAGFRSGDANRDAHMEEVLETARHPFVVLKGVARLAPAQADAQPVAATLDLQGELELHGVRTPLVVPVRLELSPDGTARARGSFEVSLDAHRIERPALLFVKVDDTCRVDVDLVLREVKP